jgi:hypothetical protein
MRRLINLFFLCFPSIVLGITLFKNPALPKITFTQLYNSESIPLNQETASAPGINTTIPFPFGKKSSEFILESVQRGFIPFGIISQQFISDSPLIMRMAFPACTLSTLFGPSVGNLFSMITSLPKKELKVIPKLLFLRGKVLGVSFPSGIVGVELAFPQAEQTALGGISRLCFMFIQNITPENSDAIMDVFGFKSIAFHNATDKEHKMLILNENAEQKKYTRSLVDDLFKGLTAKNKIPKNISDKMKEVLTKIGTTTVGVMIELYSDLVSTLNEYDKQYGLAHMHVANRQYLFWNKNNKNADELIHRFQEKAMPIVSNYYLFGKVMGYSDELIRFRYQLEGYLRAHNNVYSDGTVTWPTNIPKWGIENGINFNKWINDKWNAKLYLLSSEKFKRKQYEQDKKDAQKYLNMLPLTRKEAEAQLQDKPQEPYVRKEDRPENAAIYQKNAIGAMQQKNVTQTTVKKVETKPVTGGMIINMQPEVQPQQPLMSTQKIQKSLNEDFEQVQFLCQTYFENFEEKKESFDNLKNELNMTISSKVMSDAAIKYIATPITIASRFDFGRVEKINVKSVIEITLEQSAFTSQEIGAFIKRAEKKAEDYREIVEARQELMTKTEKPSEAAEAQKAIAEKDHELRAFIVGSIIKSGLELIKVRMKITV